MTDHEGNRKIYLARGIQEGLETDDYVIVHCFQARLNPESKMDFLLAEGSVIICFIVSLYAHCE